MIQCGAVIFCLGVPLLTCWMFGCNFLKYARISLSVSSWQYLRSTLRGTLWRAGHTCCGLDLGCFFSSGVSFSARHLCGLGVVCSSLAGVSLRRPCANKVRPSPFCQEHFLGLCLWFMARNFHVVQMRTAIACELSPHRCGACMYTVRKENR